MTGQWSVFSVNNGRGVTNLRVYPPVIIPAGGQMLMWSPLAIPEQIGVYDADGKLTAEWRRVDDVYLGVPR